jgi:DNA-binding NtrC family response regulator
MHGLSGGRRLARKRASSDPTKKQAVRLEAWQAYNWPGNLGELEHFVKRYLMVVDKELAFERNRSNLESRCRSPWRRID